MLTRLLLATALLALATTGPAAARSVYTDQQGRFSVALPGEWQAAQPESPRIALVMGRKDGNSLLGVCIVIVTETPQTLTRAQGEITEAMNAMLTKEFWVATYKAQGAQDISVALVGTRDAEGRKVHFVQSEFTTRNEDGSTQRVKAQEEIHAVPGRTHDIGCMAKKEQFALAKADFDAIHRSYTPQSGLVASAPAAPGPAMLTLFANASFGGAARVVRAETPNIAYVSWPTSTGSAIVHGFGEWQVCEGANFTGVCMNLNGPVSAATNMALKIGSARPVMSGDPLRGLANSIASDSMLALAEALRRVRSAQR